MRKKILFSLTSFMLLVSLPWASVQAKIFDLTYPFAKKTIYWPTEEGFKRQTIFYGNTPQGYFYAAYKFCAPEHGGTHIDAPRHFWVKGNTVDAIPVSQLIGNAVVIDVRDRVSNNPDYAITVKDIQDFEQKYCKLNEEDIVLFYTGWGQYWQDKKKYMGSDTLGDITHLHFPGLSANAAHYLVKQKVKGIGIDTASMDPGTSKKFWTHRIILGANLFGLENVAHLQDVPPVGMQLIVAPMKIKDGSGAPTRIYAFKTHA